MAFVSSIALPQRSKAYHVPIAKSRPVLCAKLSDGPVMATAVAAALLLVSSAPVDAAVFHFSGTRPANIGVTAERYLSLCPPTPNCISSQENVYDQHYVPSWTYNAPGAGSDSRPKKSMTEAIDDVLRVITNYPGATVISQRETNSNLGKGYYIYCEFESKFFGFVDDVEILFNPDGSTVEYRSASRLGKDDLKANRTRIKDMRVALRNEDNRWASTGY